MLEDMLSSPVTKKVVFSYGVRTIAFQLIVFLTTGNILYSKAEGVISLKEGSTQPFELDTICWIASMTKLLTSVACLQAAESGIVHLDKPVSDILPEVGKYGIMTDFDDEKNEGIYEQHKTPVTLR
jgi:CubicO group peptidase (beta-lactamase class C family)